MSYPKMPGKFSGRSDRKFSRMTALALTLTQRDAERAVARTLQSVFGYGRRAARAIADAANCNEKTALGWVEERGAPGFVHTLRLMAAVPEFAAEVRRLTGLQADMDPGFERDLQRLMQTYGNWRQNVEALAALARGGDAEASPSGSGSPQRASEETDRIGPQMGGPAKIGAR